MWYLRLEPSQILMIDYFNRNHPFHRIKVWAALAMRKRMYERVLQLTNANREMRILDVGVTPDLEIPYNNFFERWCSYTDHITACSLKTPPT